MIFIDFWGVRMAVCYGGFALGFLPHILVNGSATFLLDNVQIEQLRVQGYRGCSQLRTRVFGALAVPPSKFKVL